MKHCEKCRTAHCVKWREIERPYYNGTRRAIICEACYLAFRHTIQAAGWVILPWVVIPSRMNAGGPITEDVVMQTKPVAQ